MHLMSMIPMKLPRIPTRLPQCWWFGYDPDLPWELELFDDADFGGCTTRPTWGFTVPVGWPSTRIEWGRGDMLWALEKAVY